MTFSPPEVSRPHFWSMILSHACIPFKYYNEFLHQWAFKYHLSWSFIETIVYHTYSKKKKKVYHTYIFSVEFQYMDLFLIWKYLLRLNTRILHFISNEIGLMVKVDKNNLLHAGVWKLCKSLWVEFAISVGHVCSKRKMLVCYKVEYKGLQKVVEGCAEVTREGSCNAGKYNKITVCMLSLDSINQEKTGREFRAKRKVKHMTNEKIN